MSTTASENGFPAKVDEWLPDERRRMAKGSRAQTQQKGVRPLVSALLRRRRRADSVELESPLGAETVDLQGWQQHESVPRGW